MILVASWEKDFLLIADTQETYLLDGQNFRVFVFGPLGSNRDFLLARVQGRRRPGGGIVKGNPKALNVLLACFLASLGRIVVPTIGS